MQKVSRPSRFLPAIVALLVSASALGQQAGETVVLHGDVNEDSYLAGGTVHVRGKVDGDVVAAGGQIEIDNEVSQDVLAAGGSVAIRARVGDDVRAAGGDVHLSAQVDGDAVAAGGNVLLAPTARIGGRAWLAGGEVSVHGKVGKGVRAAGGHVVIAGEINGDVEIAARDIEIQPGAVINGSLRYRSPNEAKIDSGATITGAVLREALPARTTGERTAAGVARLGFSVSLMLAAIVLFLLFPTASVNAARGTQEAPWKSLGIGFAVLVATPIAIVLLFVTVVGMWLALAALALYLVLLLAGFLTGVFSLADLGLRRFSARRKQPTRGWRVLSIVVAFALLAVIGFFPALGALASFVLLLFGLGGLTLYLAQRYAARR